jgi:hypothetical protein
LNISPKTGPFSISGFNGHQDPVSRSKRRRQPRWWTSGDDGSFTAFPKIDAVFAINDPTAIDCDLAAKQAQRKDFFIVGVDGAPDVVPALKDPTSLIAAGAAQDPYAIPTIQTR